MISITDRNRCCGCSACENICPKNCINMIEDEEGFKYPSLTLDKCIDCGLCEKVCPELNVISDTKKMQKAYVVQNKDESILSESTSGGAFSGIAEYVIDKGGIVYGAAFDENLNVAHTYVDNKNDLYKFRNSKYVQSNIGNCFKQIKEFLNQGKLVCFSGTPCQVEGLYHFLGKDYDNLILVDVVCHAVPSPLVFRKYLEYQQSKYDRRVTNIKFREKAPYGYKYSMMTLCSDDKPIYQNGVESDIMLRAFFSNICDRPSCYKCSYKKRYRVSDFTLWDCFEVDRFDAELDNDKGVTSILLHSKKAQELFNNISDKFVYSEVKPDKLTENVRYMFFSVNENKKRENFFYDLNSMNLNDCFNKYFKDSVSVKLERTMRKTLANLGIYSVVKRNIKRLLKK